MDDGWWARTAGEVWRRITTEQAPLEPAVLGAVAAVLLALLVFRPTWRVLRHGVTLIHEAAHGLVATLAGRRLSGITLHSDSSGLTVSRGRPDGPGMIATSAAGYLGPALVGLGAAGLVAAGHPIALLWALTAVVAVLALSIRNWFGAWVVLVAGGALAGVGVALPEQAQSIVATGLTILLLLAAPRSVFDLQRSRRRRPGSASDADTLARLTHVPAILWVGFFLLMTIGCAATGLWLIGAPAFAG